MRTSAAVLVGLALATVGRAGAAQEGVGPAELSLYAGAIHWDLPEHRTVAMAGVRAGLVVFANFSLEGYWDRSPAEPGAGFGMGAGETYGVDLLWNGPPYWPGGSLFVLAGTGWGRGAYEGSRLNEVGGGYRWFLGEVAAVRLDVRAFRELDPWIRQGYRTHYRAAIGLSWLLGGGGWTAWPHPPRIQ